MTDDQDKLRSTIAELHSELESTEHIDHDVQNMLRQTIDDIHDALGEESSGDSSSIVGRLNEAARHYEETHPTLSGIIGSIIDTLGRMGI